MMCNFNSLIALYGTVVTVTGNPHFTGGTITAYGGGHIGLDDPASYFTGAATGMRFQVDQLSNITIGNRPETILPGDVSGYINPDSPIQYFNGIRV